MRNYDAQIGRWIQQDPYQEFASPYVGMGNDPINLTDPSGGSVLGLTRAGLVLVTTVGGAIIGAFVDAITGNEDGKGIAIGAGIGLAAGLGSLIEKISWSMGLRTLNVSIHIINNGVNTPSVGLDHIWSGSGKNLSMATNKNGTNSIYVIINNIKTLITNVNLNSKENRRLLANIFSYYANRAGVSMYLYGGNGTFGLLKDPKNRPSEEVKAFAFGQDVYINKNGNKISSDFSNINSTISILEHEGYHQYDNKSGIETDVYRHAKVYLRQIKSQNFGNTPPKFQLSMIRSFSNYLMDAKQKDYVGVEDIIKEFNETNGMGYKIEFGDNVQGTPCFNCKMYIYKNGKLVEIFDHKPIPDEN